MEDHSTEYEVFDHYITSMFFSLIIHY
ncbi:uncharacterized protein METZ01_LOCUS312083 [marine metagenome]|uniref:Uncharacterized protein n=1 Tax=marine metagenome TaxID=408172 RepID=A0A382NDI1_9ZZZZ